jgi:hypothetical protein
MGGERKHAIDAGDNARMCWRAVEEELLSDQAAASVGLAQICNVLGLPDSGGLGGGGFDRDSVQKEKELGVSRMDICSERSEPQRSIPLFFIQVP